MTDNPTTTTTDTDTSAAEMDIDAILAEASPPETVVPLCVNGKLRRQYEAVHKRVTERAAARDAAATVAAARASGALDGDEGDTRLGVRGTADQPEPPAPGGDEPDPEQADLDRLRAEMRRYVVPFLLRAMSSDKWTRLFEAHPPRKGADGKTDPRDWEGVDSSKFYPALVRASIAEPVVNAPDDAPDEVRAVADDRWAKISAVLTDAQFDKLARAAADLNRRDEDVPF